MAMQPHAPMLPAWPCLQLGFLCVAFPSLCITYLGQAAYLMVNPQNVSTTFYSCIPSPVYWPVSTASCMLAVLVHAPCGGPLDCAAPGQRHRPPASSPGLPSAAELRAAVCAQMFVVSVMAAIIASQVRASSAAPPHAPMLLCAQQPPAHPSHARMSLHAAADGPTHAGPGRPSPSHAAPA